MRGSNGHGLLVRRMRFVATPRRHPKRDSNPEQGFVFVGDKRLKKLQKAAWDAGWWPERKKAGILWQCTDGVGQVLIHHSASDHRAYDNLLGEFRRHGLHGV